MHTVSAAGQCDEVLSAGTYVLVPAHDIPLLGLSCRVAMV
jgi:hypothetical protein